jgi:hypothetical protein
MRFRVIAILLVLQCSMAAAGPVPTAVNQGDLPGQRNVPRKFVPYSMRYRQQIYQSIRLGLTNTTKAYPPAHEITLAGWFVDNSDRHSLEESRIYRYMRLHL